MRRAPNRPFPKSGGRKATSISMRVKKIILWREITSSKYLWLTQTSFLSSLNQNNLLWNSKTSTFCFCLIETQKQIMWKQNQNDPNLKRLKIFIGSRGQIHRTKGWECQASDPKDTRLLLPARLTLFKSQGILEICSMAWCGPRRHVAIELILPVHLTFGLYSSTDFLMGLFAS